MLLDEDDEIIDKLADALWARICGADMDRIDITLRAKLALEQRLLGKDRVCFGLDKLSRDETAAYVGLNPDTLGSAKKRDALGLPRPYEIGCHDYWRRSELDQWIETRRVAA